MVEALIAAALTAGAALHPHKRARPQAKLWLGITAALGVAGVAAHAYGTSRYMGGWKNWRQNLVDGPPIPAPPSFSGLALAGLAALAAPPPLGRTRPATRPPAAAVAERVPVGSAR